jgi:hypothetical protein
MKKLYPYFIVLALTFAVLNAHAQSGISDLLQTSPGDATKLINAYGQPLFKGIGVGMNSNWTNTAKPLKLLHFEVKVAASAAFTPASDKSFDVTQIGLSNNVRLDPTTQSPITPTIGGERSANGPQLGIYDDNNHKLGDFTMPSGKLPVIPAPQLQLTVGLIQSTDLTIRAIPSINIGSEGSVSMVGFGLKHNISQYIFGPAAKVMPFDLSVMLGWSRLNLNYDLNVQPAQNGDGVGTAQPANSNQTTDFSNQHTDAHFTSFMGEAIISKKLLFFTPFLAVGYNTTSTNFNIVGNYPITTSSDVTGTQDYYTVFTNPVSIHETSISGMRADIGFQLNLGIRIFASATLAQYKSVNGGIGFGF